MEEEKAIIRNYIKKTFPFEILKGVNNLDKDQVQKVVIQKILMDFEDEKTSKELREKLERIIEDFNKYFLSVFKSEIKEQEIKMKKVGIIRNFIKKEINLKISRGSNIDELEKKEIKENAKNKMLMPLRNEQVNMTERIRKQLEDIGDYFDEVFDTIFENEVNKIAEKRRKVVDENIYYFDRNLSNSKHRNTDKYLEM